MQSESIPHQEFLLGLPRLSCSWGQGCSQCLGAEQAAGTELLEPPCSPLGAMGDHPPLMVLPWGAPQGGTRQPEAGTAGVCLQEEEKAFLFQTYTEALTPLPSCPALLSSLSHPGPVVCSPFFSPSRFCWTSILQDDLALYIYSEFLHTQTTSSADTTHAQLQQEAHEATARHGGTGQQ